MNGITRFGLDASRLTSVFLMLVIVAGLLLIGAPSAHAFAVNMIERNGVVSVSPGDSVIVDVFLDYGDTLTSLEDDQWVAVVAFLRDSSYFSEARISHLALKAKASDLRAYASEKISEKEMVKRIVKDEY